MGMMPDVSPHGSQTLLGPSWPSMDEEELSSAAASFEALAQHLRGVVVPQLQGQQMMLSDVWTGQGSMAAMGEATAIINGHEVNAAQASAIAGKLRNMEASLVKTKMMVNTTAQRTQAQCEAIEAGPGYPEEKLAAIQSQIAMGLGQNMTDVSAGTAELGDNLGVPAGDMQQLMSGAGNPQQAMQMLTQMASKAGQMPQQLGKMAGGGKGLQSLSQPLQQMSSMFGKMGSGGSGGPSVFSNHPLTGGAGAGKGAGLVRAASASGHGGGGAGGGAGRSPMMSNLLNKRTGASATAPPSGAAAGDKVLAGAAPVGAGGGMGGGMGGAGMAGNRGQSGASRTAMAVPAPLDHDLEEDDVDDDW